MCNFPELSNKGKHTFSELFFIFYVNADKFISQFNISSCDVFHRHDWYFCAGILTLLQNDVIVDYYTTIRIIYYVSRNLKARYYEDLTNILPNSAKVIGKHFLVIIHKFFSEPKKGNIK